MFLPWWVIILGALVVYVIGKGAAAEEREECAECAEYHEGDHVPDETETGSADFDEEDEEIHAMVEKERAEEEAAASRKWRKRLKPNRDS